MKTIKLIFAALLISVSTQSFAGSEDAPKIVKATPAFDAKDVPIDMAEITLEFDRPMNKKSYMIMTPCSEGVCYRDVYWKSDTVFAVKVSLMPNKVYKLPLFKEGAKGFASEEWDEPLAKGHVWRFRTAAQ